MRIALLSQPANFHCRKWALALARAGANVSVYSLDDPAGIEGVNLVQLPTRVRWGGRYRFPAYWTTARDLRRHLEADRIDLLHPLGLTPFGLWGLWSGFRPLVPAAIGADVFDFLPARLVPEGHLHWSATQRGFGHLQKLKYIVSKKVYRKWISDLIAHSDALTCDNRPLQDALAAGFAAQNVHLIRWGIQTSTDIPRNDRWPALADELGWPIDARLILAPRGANHFYLADVVLHSFFILINKYKNYLKKNYYFLMLSTGYPVSPHLLTEASELVHSGRFHLVERVLDASEMQALWSRTDVFVSAPAYDGFSAAETEGRWAGALPVLNDIPAHREWAIPDQNAWIVKPFSAENLARTLAALMPRIDELRPNAQALNRAWIAEHADLDVQARQFLTLAESVVRRTRQ